MGRSSFLMSVGIVSNCKKLQYFVAFCKHAARNTEADSVIYSKQHSGMLQVTYFSYGLYPAVLLYDLPHHYMWVDVSSDHCTEQINRHTFHIKWPLPTMYVLMWLKISPITKWLITKVTAKWQLPSMYALMARQMALLTEWFLHTSQQNGRHPVCMRWWFIRGLCWLNDLLHTLQQNDRSPVCMRWWVFRLLWWSNDLLQTSQKIAAPLYVCADGPSDDPALWKSDYTRYSKIAAAT
jgi:hypothetical protein